ncbi:amidinotransferase [Fusobacterium necrophorum subsp. funduliforme B35]|uniref:Amidinotransferase n=2 Tax=Fusobacterium necrophorum TaxID=859 RepID=A0A0B4E4N7_9FUSO|nr:amidinotransferase [Fusobacterium necrophorum subsp. funduliforme B35]
MNSVAVFHKGEEMKSYITGKVLMIRPVHFAYNEETAVNNYYQKKDLKSPKEIQEEALKEFDTMVEVLRKNKVEVKVLEDRLQPYTPDSIFPNNWFSSHENGTVVLYPMFAENRRLERREEIYELLDENQVNILDYSKLEEEGIYLEGTGSLVLDRKNRKVYCSLSQRADERLLDIFCQDLAYEKIAFHSYQTVQGKRKEIYHTNVMMSVGEKFALLCVEAIDKREERERVVASLEEDGKEIIFITEEQVEHFLGNALEIRNAEGVHLCVMSLSAYQILTEEQKQILEKYVVIVPVRVSTIEKYGGGSARCMLAELY